MPFAAGSQHQLAMVAESSFGVTPTNPVFKKLRHVSTTLGMTKAGLVSQQKRADRQITALRHGNKQVAGDMAFEFCPDDFDELLQAVLMGTWTADVLKAGTTERSFTFERYHADIGQYLRYTGCKANSMSLSITPNTIVTGTLGIIGAGHSIGQAIISGATYTDAGVKDPFASFDGVLEEGGAPIAIVTGLELQINNGMEPTFVVGSDEAPAIQSGKSNITGTLSAYFEDETMLNKFINETASSIQVEFTLGTDVYTLLLPNIKYTAGDAPVSGDGSLVISMPFQALYDSGEGSNIVITRV